MEKAQAINTVPSIATSAITIAKGQNLELGRCALITYLDQSLKN